jgi:hypothetical protein
MTFACQFDNNWFALLLFEGICHTNSKNEKYIATTSYALSWSLVTSRARSWYEMSEA